MANSAAQIPTPLVPKAKTGRVQCATGLAPREIYIKYEKTKDCTHKGSTLLLCNFFVVVVLVL